LAVVDELDQVEFFEFGQVSVHLTHISFDEASCLADAVRVVLDDSPEDLEEFGPSNVVEVLGVVVHDFEMGIRGFTTVDSSESFVDIVVTAFDVSDTERAARSVVVCSHGHC